MERTAIQAVLLQRDFALTCFFFFASFQKAIMFKFLALNAMIFTLKTEVPIFSEFN